jgi:hypothetical protein
MAKKKLETDEDEYISVGEAAAYLSVYPGTIRKYFDLGILAGRKLPLGRRQISRRSVQALARRIKQGERVEA